MPETGNLSQHLLSKKELAPLCVTSSFYVSSGNPAGGLAAFQAALRLARVTGACSRHCRASALRFDSRLTLSLTKRDPHLWCKSLFFTFPAGIEPTSDA